MVVEGLLVMVPPGPGMDVCMTCSPCLIRVAAAEGRVDLRIGHRLVDDFLFVDTLTTSQSIPQERHRFSNSSPDTGAAHKSFGTFHQFSKPTQTIRTSEMNAVLAGSDSPIVANPIDDCIVRPFRILRRPRRTLQPSE